MLVTGASRGIGAAIARRLGRSGARVAVHFGRNRAQAEELAAELGNGARAFQADLAQPENGGALIRNVVQAFGHLDGLVNNAGVAIAAPLELDAASWVSTMRTTLDTNLVSAAVLAKEAVPHMRTRGGGRIVFVASRAAFRGDTPEYVAYAASKGGMVALARSLARALGRERIACFVIAPGFVRTDMAQDFMDRYGEGIALDDLALPELTEPEHVAPLAALMMSGLMDHATGATVDVNAGSYVH